MTTLLTTRRFLEQFGADLDRAVREAPLDLDFVALPDDPGGRLSPEECARIDIAFFSSDVFAHGMSRAFFAAAQGAPRLQWLHVFNAGIDNPVFGRFLERGVRLSTSAGSTARPIAQTAVAGLLMLARGFPHWLDAQRRHAWDPLPAVDVPADLDGQTLVVVGLGAIGKEIARLGRALGMHVVGVRRSPLRADDLVDELRPPADLPGLLAVCDWLALACPLTDETRHLIDRKAFDAMKPGTRLLNVGRGEVIDEPAMVEALRSGRLGGAYLDVFEQEPLPPGSPLWDMSNVIITPHNSAASRGNEQRTAGSFLRNLVHWACGEPLENEARGS